MFEIAEKLMAEENIILKLTFQLAIDIVAYTDVLYSLKKFQIANQLLKAGTSIAAHVREAQSPESRADFIHKMKGAHKEAEETLFWLELCKAAPSYPDPGNLIPDTDRVKRIIGKIIASSKGNK
jgi:four helix bundle protein